MPAIDVIDVPELAGLSEHLVGFFVRAVDVRPLPVDPEVWQAVVILGALVGGHPIAIPWTFGARSSKADAMGAVEVVLRNLVAGRLEAMARFPWAVPDEDPEVERHGARSAAVTEWLTAVKSTIANENADSARARFTSDGYPITEGT